MSDFFFHQAKELSLKNFLKKYRKDVTMIFSVLREEETELELNTGHGAQKVKHSDHRTKRCL